MLRYFDLHCDTIPACIHNEQGLYENNLHVDIKGSQKIDRYIQCFAAFIPDNIRGEAAFSYFKSIYNKLFNETEINRGYINLCKNSGDLEKAEAEKKISAIFTVENGAALGGKLEHLYIFSEMGVKLITLTWNAENELGTGILSKESYGITDFGKRALTKMAELNMIADVSHASERLFYDVAEYSEKPFIATHSNSKKLCSHVRNLTDEQFCIIKDSGGIVGINFYTAFLNNETSESSMLDILRHVEHFLAIGGEDTLAMGSDFDGAEIPLDMKGISSIPDLYEIFLKHNYSEDLINKLFFGNARNFFLRNNLL